MISAVAAEAEAPVETAIAEDVAETPDAPIDPVEEVEETETAEAAPTDAPDVEKPKTAARHGRVIRVRKQSLMTSLQAALSSKAAASNDTPEPAPLEPVDEQPDSETPDQLAERADGNRVVDFPETPAIEPEVETAIDASETADIAPDPVDETPPGVASSLSPDDEADLLRELEAVEREMAADTAEVAALEAESQAEALETLTVDTASETHDSLEEALSALAFASHSNLAEPVSEDDVAQAETAQEEEAVEEDAHARDVIANIMAHEETATSEEEDAPEDDSVIDAVARVALASEQEARAEAAAERRALALEPQQEDSANVSRLMEEADSKLAGPELRRRRSAIEHLKAAVAATKAEGPRRNADDEEASPYRDDLRKVVSTAAQALSETREDPIVEAEDPAPIPTEPPAATAEPIEFEPRQEPEPAAAPAPVRPRRPVLSEGRERESRPVSPAERAKVAPLMLVSEQRVDAEDAAPSEAPAAESAAVRPVRPRRVTAGRMVAKPGLEAAPARAAVEEIDSDLPRPMVSDDTEAAGIFAESTTFDDFSERMGAKGLEELLECAAAYTSYVQGRRHFSHPEIMDVVRQVEGQQDSCAARTACGPSGNCCARARFASSTGVSSRFLKPLAICRKSAA